jgi:hypothetical protein
MPKAFGAIGRNPLASRTDLILSTIESSREISRSALLELYGSEVTSEELDQITNFLTITKRTAPVMSRNGDITYRTTGKKANNGNENQS